MKVADDFRQECKGIEQLIASIRVQDFDEPTGFKNWTVNNILRHLHVWNKAAVCPDKVFCLGPTLGGFTR